jgi:hypothetical protein
MADNDYDIPFRFPLGLHLNRLTREMFDVWPTGVAKAAEYTSPGSPTTIQIVGNLRITTVAPLTASQQADALAHFLTHDGSLPPLPGVLLVELPPPADSPGVVLYVRDADRATGAGLGCMLYSDSVAWRRISDDAVP